MPEHTRVPAYECDPYATQLDSVVLRVGEDDGRPYAVLEDTLLYPEGGGQPADRGDIGGVAVLDVQMRGGEVRHYLDQPIAPGPVAVSLDWARRFDHMQQHTAQHLLTALAQDRFGWATTAFHLGESHSDVELAAPHLSLDDLARLELAAAGEIRASRPVTARRVTAEEFVGQKVRTRGLPEGHAGTIRLVEIGGVDLNTCGGTHVRCTAEIESLKLLGTEQLRGGTRVFFVAGGRVRGRLQSHEERCARMRSLLGAPDDRLVPALEAKLDQLREAERRGRELESELTVAMAESLARRAEKLVDCHVEGKDAGFLRQLSRAIFEASAEKVLFLTATLSGQSFFLVAAGQSSNVDVAAIGREVAALLDARGGGSGRLFQGKAPSLAGREAALTRLRAAIDGA